MTMTISAPEVRPVQNLDTQAKAVEHDTRVRELDAFIRGSWAELGWLCIMIRNGEEWRLLGHGSFDAWLLDAAPYSRASCYAGMKAFEELANDFSPEELTGIPHGNAHVLKLLSKEERSNPKIREAAKKQRPKQFRETVIKEYPDAHVESQVKKVFVFDDSAWIVISCALDFYRDKMEEPNLSDVAVIEAIMADWKANYE